MFELIGNAKAQINVRNLGLTPIDATSGIDNIVAAILTWVLWIAGVLAVIYLIYSGILYITAGGDAEKATKGRTGVINAIIGIIIILLAGVITVWVSNTLSAR